MTDLKDGGALSDFWTHLVPVATLFVTLGGLAGAKKAWDIWHRGRETEEEKDEENNRRTIDRIDQRTQNDLDRMGAEITRKDEELQYYRTELNREQRERSEERVRLNTAFETERSSGVRWYGVARGWYFYAAMLWESWQRSLPPDGKPLPGFEGIVDNGPALPLPPQASRQPPT